MRQVIRDVRERSMPDDPSINVSAHSRFGWVMRRSFIGILLLGLLIGFGFQGTRGLWSPDEGRYVDGAVQMLESGNFLAPAYSPGRLNFSKPPATYWLIAASLKAFGRNTWAARLPFALAFTITLMLLYGIGRQLLPERAWLPALIYASALFPFLTVNLVSTDVFLTMFEALAMLGFLRAAFGDGDRSRRWYFVLMWLGFGLAFLTKGPPGLLPLVAVLAFVAGRDGWRALGPLLAPVGILVFVLVGTLWYIVVMLRYPWLPHYFMHREVYERLFTTAQRRHPGAFGWIVAYVPTFVLGALPWWPALFGRGSRALLTDHWRRLRAGRHTIERFLLLWLLLPLLVFCLAQSRLPLYVLPLFLPLALIFALVLQHRVDIHSMRQRVALGVWIVVLLAIKGGVALLTHSAADDRLVARQLVALSGAHAYAGIAFIEDTDLDYETEERTPWGLRLYLDKPIFGIAWRHPQGSAEMCRVVHAHVPTLLVLDPPIKPSAVEATLRACGLRGASWFGSWQQHALAWVPN